jgi:hypothetical protein
VLEGADACSSILTLQGGTFLRTARIQDASNLVTPRKRLRKGQPKDA